MEMNLNPAAAPVGEVPTRSTGIRSWMLALVLGAVLALAGAASVFAASPSADPSASPGASSSEDAGGSTEGSTDTGRDCPARSGTDSSGTDTPSS